VITSQEQETDVNLVGQGAEAFIEYYNKNIPTAFPHATRKSLKEFQSQYPSLFGDSGEWIINKHRKKYMDWLVSHSD